jgi:EH domain-containing protein 1
MTDNYQNGGEAEDRTAMIAARLKQLYTKSILPVEKKYRYDYFFDSPLLSDVEFDGANKMMLLFSICNGDCSLYRLSFSSKPNLKCC